jgi:hypothetical protein
LSIFFRDVDIIGREIPVWTGHIYRYVRCPATVIRGVMNLKPLS